LGYLSINFVYLSLSYCYTVILDQSGWLVRKGVYTEKWFVEAFASTFYKHLKFASHRETLWKWMYYQLSTLF